MSHDEDMSYEIHCRDIPLPRTPSPVCNCRYFRYIYRAKFTAFRKLFLLLSKFGSYNLDHTHLRMNFKSLNTDYFGVH